MSNQKRLAQLDTILDKMFESESFRQRAKESGLDVLHAAATLIESNPPQLPVITRHLIRQKMLDVFDDVMAISQSVSDTTPSLSKVGRNNILEKMMASQETHSQPEPALSGEARDRIFGKMLVAQQQLQLDALVASDEGLAIARTSDDPVIQAAVKLHTTPPPQLSDVARTRIHKEMLPAPQITRSKPILSPRFVDSLQRVAASIAILIFICIVAVPPASADSLPGDMLYPVKRGLETFSLQFAGSKIERAKMHINQAYERLDELSQLGDPAPVAYRLIDDALESAGRASELIEDHHNVVLQNNLNAVMVETSQAIASSELENSTMQALKARLDVLIVSTEPDNTTNPLNNAQVNRNNSGEQELVTSDEVSEPEETQEPPAELTQTVDESQEPETTTIPTDAITLYANASTYVRVRSTPTLASSIVTRIEPGDAVTQIGTSDDSQWTQVLLASGEEGWIANFLLVDYPVTPVPIVPVVVEDPQNPASGQANSAASNTTAGSNAGVVPDTTLDTRENQGNNGVRANANGRANGASANAQEHSQSEQSNPDE